MSYLILGSNSFAGSSFVNYLLTKEENIIGISRSKELHPVMQPYFNHSNKRAFKFFQLDINQDTQLLFELIKQHKPRYIVDFVGQSGIVAESWNNPTEWYQTNIISKTNLHHFLKDCDFLERYVKVSTPAVYGNTPKKVLANAPANPSTPYAVSHAAIDMSLLAFYKQYQFPVILTRFANFYGPHQQLYRIIPRTIICGLLGKKLSLHGDGISERMFIYANDISTGIYQAIQRGKLGEIYHFANEPCLSMFFLVKTICELMSVRFENLVEVTAEYPEKDNKHMMDTAQSQAELNWVPMISLEQGLSRTIAWIRKNIDTIETLPLNRTHQS